MGMDVFGNAPTSDVGAYFRRNVWGWKPLADLIEELVDPVITSGCKYWHTNDGDGLDAEGAAQLSDALDRLIESGVVAEYITTFDREIAALPNVTCEFCDGTGTRTDNVGVTHRMPQTQISRDAKDVDGQSPHPRAGQFGWCNACSGRGYSRPMIASYYFEEQDVREFSAFARASGGFRIC